MERQIALQGVLPGCAVFLALLALFAKPWRRARLEGFRTSATALALAGGYAAGHVSFFGWSFPPSKPVEVWPWLALAAAACALAAEHFPARARAALLFALLAICGAGFTWAILAPVKEYYAWSDAALAARIAGFALAWAGLAALLGARARREPGLAADWLAPAAGLALALFAWGSSTGTTSLTVAAAAGALAAGAALARPGRVGAHGSLTVGLGVVALAAATARYRNDLPLAPFALLAGAPFAALLPLERRGAAGRIARWALGAGLAALGAWLAHSGVPENPYG